jgi:hypothetical protein
MRAPHLLALGVLTVLGACAGTPPAPTPAAPAKAAPAAPPTTTAAAPAASTATGPGGVSIDTYNKARQAGYRAKVVSNNRTILCRTEAGLGTRIAKETCVSADSLEESLRQAETVRDQMRRGNSCGMDDCAGK